MSKEQSLVLFFMLLAVVLCGVAAAITGSAIALLPGLALLPLAAVILSAGRRSR